MCTFSHMFILLKENSPLSPQLMFCIHFSFEGGGLLCDWGCVFYLLLLVSDSSSIGTE
jgi:hypothetical protein